MVVHIGLGLVLNCIFVVDFETIPHSVVAPEVYIGTCGALLSMIVTIAIGWQIFHVVEVKNTMKELRGKQENLDKQKDEFKEEKKLKNLQKIMRN